MKDDILIGDTPKAVKRRGRIKGAAASGRLWKHAKLADIYGLVDQAQIEEYFVFTLVRNPWDRMVSYYHWLREQGFKHPAVTLAKTHEFSAFLNHKSTVQSFRNDNASRYVVDRNGVDQCNLYLRLEHLETDLEALQQSIGIKLPPMPHTNKSKRTNEYQTFFTSNDVALIADIFANDIKQFDYQFAPISSQ